MVQLLSIFATVITLCAVNVIGESCNPQGSHFIKRKRPKNPLVIDEFSDWESEYTNKAGHGRDSVGTRGNGFITLNGFQNYLLEFFAKCKKPVDLNDKAFVFTYTTEIPVTCEISLISQEWEGPRVTSPYPRGTFVNHKVEFVAGQRSSKRVPISDLLVMRPEPATQFYGGVAINGPYNPEDLSRRSLTLHRVELI